METAVSKENRWFRRGWTSATRSWIGETRIRQSCDIELVDEHIAGVRLPRQCFRAHTLSSRGYIEQIEILAAERDTGGLRSRNLNFPIDRAVQSIANHT